jgi:hypothetical protein
MECVADAPTDSGKSGAAVFAENEDGFYIYSVWIILSPFPSPLLLLESHNKWGKTRLIAPRLSADSVLGP